MLSPKTVDTLQGEYLAMLFNSYVYFRHKKFIYYKIYIQLDKIYIMIYNHAIRSIRTEKSVINRSTNKVLFLKPN